MQAMKQSIITLCYFDNLIAYIGSFILSFNFISEALLYLLPNFNFILCFNFILDQVYQLKVNNRIFVANIPPKGSFHQ